MSLLRWMGMAVPAGLPANVPAEPPTKDDWYSRSEERYFGMENFGNTCYANSVIQALYFCKPFRELVQLSGPPVPSSSAAGAGGPGSTTVSTPGSTFINPSHIDPHQSPLAGPSSSSSSRPAVPRALTTPNLSGMAASGGTGSGHSVGGSGGRGGSQRADKDKGKEKETPSGGGSGAVGGPGRPTSRSGLSAGKASLTSVWGGSQRRAANATKKGGAPAPNNGMMTGQQGAAEAAETTTRGGGEQGGNTKAETTAGPAAGSPAASPGPGSGPGPNANALSSGTGAAAAAAAAKPRHFGAADMALDHPGVGAFVRQPTAESHSTFPLNINSASVSDTILSTLRDLFLTISQQPKPTGAIAPHAFITTVKRRNELFRSTQHQDAHEFFNYLVNAVAEDVVLEGRPEATPPAPASTPAGSDAAPGTVSMAGSVGTLPTLAMPRLGEPGPTWVHKLFEGVLTNETRCLTCETVSQRDEAFLDLSIDIEQNASVTACLKQFSASEMLTQKNKFSCDRCGGLQEAEKRMKIKKLPNVLPLHLKRFKYQEELQRYTKLTYRVVFPFELRLFNTTDDIANPDRLYELWAIIIHIGAGPHHGHYVTILKSDGRWLLFDDNTVTPIEESEIQKYYGDGPAGGSGYVLFYQAVDLDLTEVVKAAGLNPSTVAANMAAEVESAPSVVVDGKQPSTNGLTTSELLTPTPSTDGRRTASSSPSRKGSVGDGSSAGSAQHEPGAPFSHQATAPARVGSGKVKTSLKTKRALGLGIFGNSAAREARDDGSPTAGRSSSPEKHTGGATPEDDVPTPPRTRRTSFSRPVRRASTAPVTQERTPSQGTASLVDEPLAGPTPPTLSSSGSRFFKRSRPFSSLFQSNELARTEEHPPVAGDAEEEEAGDGAASPSSEATARMPSNRPLSMTSMDQVDAPAPAAPGVTSAPMQKGGSAASSLTSATSSISVPVGDRQRVASAYQPRPARATTADGSPVASPSPASDGSATAGFRRSVSQPALSLSTMAPIPLAGPPAVALQPLSPKQVKEAAKAAKKAEKEDAKREKERLKAKAKEDKAAARARGAVR